MDVLETQYGGGFPGPAPRSFWPYLIAYVGFRFLQGSGGLNALRDVSESTVAYGSYFVGESLHLILISVLLDRHCGLP